MPLVFSPQQHTYDVLCHKCVTGTKYDVTSCYGPGPTDGVFIRDFVTDARMRKFCQFCFCYSFNLDVMSSIRLQRRNTWAQLTWPQPSQEHGSEKCYIVSGVISGFRRGINEIFAVTEMLCKQSKKKNYFRTAWPLTMGPIGCSETPANNYQSALYYILEEQRSQMCFHFITSVGEDLVLRVRYTYSENAVFIHWNPVITLWEGTEYVVSL
jgi:hypothetical protein